MDVTDHVELDRVIDGIAKRYGGLDAVFANAGIDPGVGYLGDRVGTDRPRIAKGSLERYTNERWNRVIDVNLNGIFATRERPPGT